MVMKSALTVSLTAHQLLPAVSASPDSVLPHKHGGTLGSHKNGLLYFVVSLRESLL